MSCAAWEKGRPTGPSEIVKVIDGLTLTSLTETAENPAWQ
jgi:hypothetical protein